MRPRRSRLTALSSAPSAASSAERSWSSARSSPTLAAIETTLRRRRCHQGKSPRRPPRLALWPGDTHDGSLGLRGAPVRLRASFSLLRAVVALPAAAHADVSFTSTPYPLPTADNEYHSQIGAVRLPDLDG